MVHGERFTVFSHKANRVPFTLHLSPTSEASFFAPCPHTVLYTWCIQKNKKSRVWGLCLRPLAQLLLVFF